MFVFVRSDVLNTNFMLLVTRGKVIYLLIIEVFIVKRIYLLPLRYIRHYFSGFGLPV